MPQRKTEKTNTGPEPERLEIEGDWQDAVKTAIESPPAPKIDEPESEFDESDGQTDPSQS